MISILNAYKSGLKIAWAQKKMLLFIYFINLIFAYLMTLPFSMIISGALKNTIMADKLLNAFDYTALSTIMNEFGAGFSFGSVLFVYGIFYLLLNTFFAGGIISLFHEEENFSLKQFLSGSIEFFKRFLRLFLISLIFIIVAFLIYSALGGFFGLFTKNTITEFWPFVLFFVRILILGILLALVNMIFDYAKIITVVNDFTGMWKSTKNAIMFVMMSFRKTSGLYGLYFFTASLLIIIYLLIESYLHVGSGLMVFVFFIFTQIYMLFKMWIRLSFFGGQYVFYKHSNTAMPGMTKEMLDMAVAEYENREAKGEEREA